MHSTSFKNLRGLRVGLSEGLRTGLEGLREPKGAWNGLVGGGLGWALGRQRVGLRANQGLEGPRGPGVASWAEV